MCHFTLWSLMTNGDHLLAQTSIKHLLPLYQNSIFASPTNLHEPSFLPQPLLVPLYHLDAFLPKEAMMKGGGTPFFFSGQQIPPSLSASFSPLCFPEHPRLSPAFAHAPSSCQTQVDARGRGKTADAGQSRALERLAGHPTVDAESPYYLEPCANRCPSTSAPRQHAAHLLPRPPLSPAARARMPPRSANARAAPVAARSSSRSSSLSLAP